MLWCDLLGFASCYNYLHYNEYPKLYDILASRFGRENEDEMKQISEESYEKAKEKLVSNYRAKFYTDSQFWH